MAYRGTITVAGLPAKSLHVYDEGLVLAKSRLLRSLLFVMVISAGCIAIALLTGSWSFVPIAVISFTFPSLWLGMTKRPLPASFQEARQARGLSVVALDEISSANLDEGSHGKRSLTIRTKQGSSVRYVWWVENSVGPNPDDKVKQMLAPITAKPRSFY